MNKIVLIAGEILLFLIAIVWSTTYFGLLNHILQSEPKSVFVIIYFILQTLYLFYPIKLDRYISRCIMLLIAIVNYIVLYFYDYAFLAKIGLVF